MIKKKKKTRNKYLKLNSYFVVNAMCSYLLGTSLTAQWAYDEGKRKESNQVALPSMLKYISMSIIHGGKEEQNKKKVKRRNVRNNIY